MSLLENVEATLVGALGLTPRVIAPSLASMSVDYRGKAFSVRARAYSGGTVAYARFVQIDSPSLKVDNALVLPTCVTAQPIYGVDIVRPGVMAQWVVALDLSPTSRSDEPRIAQALGSDWHPSAPDPARWARDQLSASAFVGRFDALPLDLDLRMAMMTRAFVDLAVRRSVDNQGARLEQRSRYVRAHRDDQHGMKVVRRLLGERFVDEVLFPPWLAPVNLVEDPGDTRRPEGGERGQSVGV
ncbi:MAG: hypothetical protein ACAI38_07535 [Myxococcota bacterium]